MCVNVLIIELQTNTIKESVPCVNENIAKMIHRSKRLAINPDLYITEVQEEVKCQNWN